MENQWKSCIEACLACATRCNQCATACLKEEHVQHMTNCIALDMQCASICYSAAQLMSMGSHYAPEICRICAEICEACGNECKMHDAEHCQACAQACLNCAEECRKMMEMAHA